jgi:hypothetical protein
MKKILAGSLITMVFAFHAYPANDTAILIVEVVDPTGAVLSNQAAIPGFSALTCNAAQRAGAIDIRYTVFENGRVALDVYDSKGACVAQPVRAVQTPGLYRLAWPGDRPGKVPDGLYCVVLKQVGRTHVQKVILIR